MTPYTLHLGDCLDVAPGLPMADAIVTDPPSGIAFMGAEWDRDRGGRDAWVAWLAARLKAARGRLRPGGYALVWALPRTSHWTACAIEDAGFVIQDRLAHIFGSGFPKHKSHLKPAVEDWWLAYNPGGPRALQVDACRVGTDEVKAAVHAGGSMGYHGGASGSMRHFGNGTSSAAGRWPPHLLLTHSADCDDAACSDACPVAILGAQSGERSSRPGRNPRGVRQVYNGGWTPRSPRDYVDPSDTGTAARFYPQFFYASKASRREREAGLEGRERRSNAERDGRQMGNNSANSLNGSGKPLNGTGLRNPTSNYHPTVKSLALMRWLVRLVTPAGGLVLDPFMGSGSTGCAAVLEGMRFVGIEQDAEYLEIARARIAHYADPLQSMEAA